MEGSQQKEETGSKQNHSQEGIQQHQKLQKAHDAWKHCETLQIWEVYPYYDASYSDIQTTHELPLPLTENNFHKAYAIGWVNTNNHQEHIDISMEKLEIRRKGEVIAKIQALNNG